MTRRDDRLNDVPVILYDVKSRGAEAYLALAREVLARATPTAA